MCTSPLTIGKAVPPTVVSCGQCIECRINYSRSWMVRMMCESYFWDKISFLTLTYRDACLTYGNLLPSLVPRDLQLFIKRLRKRLGIRVSFYACGEYGDTTRRPHYHLILFGEDFSFDRVPSRKSKSGFPMFTSPTLDKVWGLGDCFISDASHEAMQYTAGYVLKKLTGKMSEFYELNGIEPEFSRASRNPAIGKRFFDRFSSEILSHDFVRIADFKTAVPSYFNRLYKRDNYYKYELVKELRRLSSDQSDRNDSPRTLARGVIKSIEHFKAHMRDFE